MRKPQKASGERSGIDASNCMEYFRGALYREPWMDAEVDWQGEFVFRGLRSPSANDLSKMIKETYGKLAPRGSTQWTRQYRELP